jgi:hypothetical protein
MTVLTKELFKSGGVESGCIRVEATPDLLYIYESVHEDQEPTQIALEMDEARILLAFLKVVIPDE